MSSHAEIIAALTAFYQEVIKQPGLNDSALKIPPAAGWDTLNPATLRSAGKSEEAIEMLRHIPYLEAIEEYQTLLVGWETVPLAYTQNATSSMESCNPLPSHCVYLTEGVGREGYSLILDTEKGEQGSNKDQGRKQLTKQAQLRHIASQARRSLQALHSPTTYHRMNRGGLITRSQRRAISTYGPRSMPAWSTCWYSGLTEAGLRACLSLEEEIDVRASS